MLSLVWGVASPCLNVGTAASGDKLGGQGCAGACLLFGGSKRGRVEKDAIKVDKDELTSIAGSIHQLYRSSTIIGKMRVTLTRTRTYKCRLRVMSPTKHRKNGCISDTIKLETGKKKICSLRQDPI